MNRFALLVLALSTACSPGTWGLEGSDDDNRSDTGSDWLNEGDTDAATGQSYQLAVYPTRNGEVGLLPQAFDLQVRSTTDVELELAAPVTLSGNITGYLITPRVTNLPGTRQPVAAEVGLLSESTVQSRYGAASDDGDFALSAVPGSVYDLVLIPELAGLPFLHESISLDRDVSIDFDLDSGVALWGRVLSNGTPLANVRVAAENTSGVRGEPVLTNANGYFELRVLPGMYRVLSLGRDNGRDPAVRGALVEVGSDGARSDIEYASLELFSVGGRAVSGTNALSGARIRFTSASLDGYAGMAEVSVEAVANTDGNFDTRLVPGVYTIELLPRSDQAAASYTISGVNLEGDTDLGVLTAPGFSSISTTVLDDQGLPVAGASARCTEAQGDQRSYTGSSDSAGVLELSLPTNDVRCLITPPGGSSELAALRVDLDLGETDFPTLQFGRGHTVSGTLVSDSRGADVSLAIVEVRDPNGTLWGTTVTDSAGRFSLQVAWPQESR